MLNTRTDRMTINQFLLHIAYSTDRPNRISVPRWIGMIAWAKKRGYIS
jgi:hypothetical protein